ncbi:TlpA disulfide reductase family protein [Plebeiibacterium sediminum]|uniref:AhpC/TSA family protein n=1 Tax=Plebeiibacterium sediminum TaxID=2992112 RepID=A0AAE3M5X4_9BACT|nr:TlpA disulfide reductase family protein [Plebeiobacterium sediminum]MCW3787769.1 AhpC/TSA family protein [Plebeiobacterium sediminum]
MRLERTKKKLSLLTIAALAAFSFGLKAQESDPLYHIVIKMDNVNKEAPAMLGFKTNTGMHIDTAFVNANNEFVFEGPIPKINRAFLNLAHEKIDPTMPPNNGDGISIYLEEGTLLIEGKDSLQTANYSGTPLNEDNNKLGAIGKAYTAKINVINNKYSKAMEAGDKELAAKMEEEYAALMDEKKQKELEFVYANNNSIVSLDWLRQNVNVIQEKSLATKVFNQFTEEVKKSPAGLIYSNILGQTKGADIGFEAPDISAKQPSGETLSLRSLRGKYVLLDFWASWCGPCRRENPNLVKSYNEFKDKNFTILGYSLDGGNKAFDNWTAAIEKDGLVWNQISDLGGWRCLPVQLYGISSVPTNFLIDPSGKIIAKNLRGADLDAKLKEILK